MPPRLEAIQRNERRCLGLGCNPPQRRIKPGACPGGCPSKLVNPGSACTFLVRRKCGLLRGVGLPLQSSPARMEGACKGASAPIKVGKTGGGEASAPDGVHTAAYQLRYGRGYLGKRTGLGGRGEVVKDGRICRIAQTGAIAAGLIGLGLVML